MKFLKLATIITCLLFCFVFISEALHLKGTFKNNDFFKFLVKFGFQKVDSIDEENSQGFIYGNITAKTPELLDYDMYFVVVERHYFVQFYALKGNTSLPDQCKHMFSEIDTIAWDKYCAKHGKEDFLRRVPCKKNSICLEELDVPSSVVPNYQFTFHVTTNQVR